MVSREAAKARNPRRKPWVTECLRELSREAANTLRGKHNPWANAHGYVLSPLRGYKQCIFKKRERGTVSGNPKREQGTVNEAFPKTSLAYASGYEEF
jgi:hypothetical protein